MAGNQTEQNAVEQESKPVVEYEHVRERKESRKIQTADTAYTIAVEKTENGEYVAFERDGTLEAIGFSSAEAIANYARAVEIESRRTGEPQGEIAREF